MSIIASSYLKNRRQFDFATQLLPEGIEFKQPSKADLFFICNLRGGRN